MPLRAVVVGAGPAGFYTAEQLLDAGFEVDVLDALKLGLISMDSTLRSNLSVGLPVDLHVSRTGALKSAINFRIQPEEPYFHDLRERWSKALRDAHLDIPRPPWAVEAS